MRIRAFLLCFLVLVLRGWDRLAHPGLWAEDGSVFLKDALDFGWSALLIPYEGYFHTLNRLVMQLLLNFPLTWLPGLVTFVCFGIYAWVMSIFAERTYRYLLKSDFMRLGIALGLCILPGGIEMLGNLCNLHRILAVYIFFLSIRSAQDDYNPIHLASVLLIGGSAGEILVFVPVFLYRSYLRRKQRPQLSDTYEFVMVCAILAWTLLNIAASKTNSEPFVFQWWQILRSTFAAYSFGYVMQPLFGWRLSENIFRFVYPLYFVLVSFISFFLLRHLWRTRNSGRFLFTLAIVCLCAIQELSWLVRPSDLAVFNEFFPGMWWGRSRIPFNLLFGGFLFWALFFGQKSTKKGFAYLLLYWVLSNELAVKSYGNVDYWPKVATDLTSSIETGCPPKVVVPLFPEAWHFEYQSAIFSPEKPCPD